jgi:hypothetical protein
MTNDVPVSIIKEQALTDTPTTGDSTLVDDTVVLVDGTALVGGPNTITENIKTSVKPSELFTKIPRSS